MQGIHCHLKPCVKIPGIAGIELFLHLGLSLYEVVRLSTEATARTMGMADRLGTLKVGAEGDATMLRLDQGRFKLTDSMGVSVQANEALAHVKTVRAGRVHRPYLRST